MKYEKAIKRIEYLKNKAEIALNNNEAACGWLKKDVEGTITAFSMAIEALEKQATTQATSNYTSEWIPVSERLPEEHDTMFAKFKGTDKWSDYMFAKKSDKVNVTVEFDDGSRMTQTLYTIDGEWKRETNIKHKVIAWRPLPEPYKGE